MSTLVFREAVLSAAESQEDWRTLDFSNGDLDASRTSASAGGFSYTEVSSHRFIAWRAASGDLDLFEYCLEAPLAGNAIRLRFGKDIIPNVLFKEVLNESEGLLVLIVLLRSAITGKISLKRLCFGHPKFFENFDDIPGSLQSSVFADASVESVELSIDDALVVASKEGAVSCELVDEMNVYVGCASGSIVHIQLDPLNEAQSFTESTVKERAAILSTLKGLVPVIGSKKSQIGCIGLATFREFVFALYEDATLRVWSSQRGNTLVLSLKIPIEAWNPEAPAISSSWALRIFHAQHDEKQPKLDVEDESRGEARRSLDLGAENELVFRLGVFVGLNGDSQVQVYRGLLDEVKRTIFLQMEGVSYYYNDKLVDFQICAGQTNSIDEDYVHPKVWAMWRGVKQEEDAEFVLAHTPISRSKSSQVLEINNWSSARLESPASGLESLIAPSLHTHPNIGEAFLSHLLEPGRFTIGMLVAALATFSGDPSHLNLHPNSIRELKAIISSEIRKETLERLAAITQQPPSTEVAWRTAHGVWIRYLELCIQVWKSEHEPLALFCVPNTSGLVIVIKHAHVSVLRETSPLESLTLLAPNSRATFQHSLLGSMVHRATGSNTRLQQQPNHAAELFKVLDTMDMVATQIGDFKLETFEQRLFHLTDPVISASCDIEYLFGSPIDYQSMTGDWKDSGLSNDQRISHRTFINRFVRSARSIARIDVSLSQILSFIESQDSSDPTNSSNLDTKLGLSLYPDISGNLQGLQSDLIDDAIASGFKQCVTTRFELLRDMLYLALLTAKAELQLNLDAKVVKAVAQLLPRIAEQLKAYHVLKWLSSQYVSGNPVDAVFEAPRRRLGPKFPLDGALLKRRLAAGPIPVILLYLKDIRAEFTMLGQHKLWRCIGFSVGQLIRLVHPGSAAGDSISLANQLLCRGQHLVLSEYIRLLDNKSSYHRDLLGDCYMAMAQHEKAMDCFVQASVNVEYEAASSSLGHPLIGSVRQALGRDRYEKESLALYYWNALIPDLVFQNVHDLVVQASTCALSCATPGDDSTYTSLYSHIFTSSLAIGLHEQAYAALIHIDSGDSRKMEALSELVLTLVDSGKAKELAELPFVNLLDQVHNIILSRARTSDIIDRSPNLYQVLYAFHLAKSNYKLAAEAMFTYAERLSSEHHLGLAILERYSAALLAVLNVLKLLEPQQAFIVTRRNTSHPSPSKRSRDLDLDLDLLSLDKDDQSIDGKTSAPFTKRIVEVYDIERIEQMQFLATCNLKLARIDKALAITSVRSPSVALSLLVSHDEFELAYQLAAKTKLKMDEIFSKHALVCLKQGTSQVKTESERWGDLRRNLERYDETQTNFHYHVVVADTILRADSRIKLPIWLVYAFKSGEIAPKTLSALHISSVGSSAISKTSTISTVSGSSSSQSSSDSTTNAMELDESNGHDAFDASSAQQRSIISESNDKSSKLLLLYLKHGLTEDAAKLASEMIIRGKLRLQAHLSRSSTPDAPFQTMLPYQYIEQVLVRLQKMVPANEGLHQKVSVALKEYMDLAVEASNAKMELADDE